MSPTLAALLLLLESLPNVRELAAAKQGERELSEVSAELEEEFRNAGTAYVRTMPFRTPPKPCSTGAHSVTVAEHRIIAPALKAEATLTEAALHEAKEHGAALPKEVGALLERLRVKR